MENMMKYVEFNRKVDTPEGTAVIINKLSQSNIEVNLYLLKSGHSFHLNPPSHKKGFKSYWILRGEIHSIDGQFIYSEGDLLTLTSDSDIFHIIVVEEAEILVHTVNEKSFQKSTNEFRYIHFLLEKIHIKDEYTFEHSKTVYDYSKKVGLALGYNGNRFNNLLLAAQYHDIGKIYICDSILKSQNELSNNEFETMKKHAVMGKDILNQFFVQEVFKIVSQHHERLDGSGYPYGLKYEQILEEAQIIAICDSYDAMTSDRLYNNSMSKDEALHELMSLAPLKYNKQIVELFSKIAIAERA